MRIQFNELILMNTMSPTYIHGELECSPLKMSSGEFEVKTDETFLTTKIRLCHLHVNSQLPHIFICL